MTPARSSGSSGEPTRREAVTRRASRGPAKRRAEGVWHGPGRHTGCAAPSAFVGTCGASLWERRRTAPLGKVRASDERVADLDWSCCWTTW